MAMIMKDRRLDVGSLLNKDLEQKLTLQSTREEKFPGGTKLGGEQCDILK